MGKFSITVSRLLLKALYILPISKHKVFFSSYEGKQFSCNPKYIFLELRRRNKKITYVYEYNNTKHLPIELIDGVKVVKHNSISYFVQLLTSRIVITNNGVSAKIPVRKSQTVINVWHAGGAYKKHGKDIDSTLNGSDTYYLDQMSRQTSYFLSSSKKFSEIINSGMGIEFNKFLNTGMPRNDIFFSDKPMLDEISSKVKKKLGIASGEKIVLYAPTYRGNAGGDTGVSGERLNVDCLLKKLTSKFGGDWKFVYRGHYFSHSTDIEGINASSYPDMQELLVTADALLTDYSSSVWDFSFTDKPGFLYTPDLVQYKNERDFYIPIEEWPYPCAMTNYELINNIDQYDKSTQQKRNQKHHETLCSYENGHGTEQVVRIVNSILKTGDM